ncbi:Hypothetical protein R9X50_00253900 [Acrodontium crateriforme]|uniref:Uncharacterized protein n=1 Tax=Acrodontium crateriforme TaxID=150365 RepID=A0AAQ3R3J7_9PEZI|nr:Hypothetical protein R9X50_00253900 [Acrodontium crateriforme]
MKETQSHDPPRNDILFFFSSHASFALSVSGAYRYVSDLFPFPGVCCRLVSSRLARLSWAVWIDSAEAQSASHTEEPLVERIAPTAPSHPAQETLSSSIVLCCTSSRLQTTFTMSYIGEDDYDYEYESRHRRRRPSFDARRTTTTTAFLDPGAHMRGGGLHRTRSTGGAPAPVVNIYNDQIQDHYSRQDSYSRSGSPRYAPPPPAMAPPPQMPISVPVGVPMPYPVPEYRGRSGSRGRHLGDGLVEDLAEMAIRDRLRSRSRGRSDAGAIDRSEFYEWQLQEERRKQEDARRRAAWDAEAELKRIKEQAKRKADEEEEKEERKRVIAEYEEKKRKEAEEAKEEERRIREKVEREKKEAKEREEREWNEFLRKQKEKEEKEKAEKKAEKEKLEIEMRRRLENFGYTQEQIDIMVDEEKAKKYKEDHKRGPTTTTTTTSSSLEIFKSRAPTYAKIHRDYLSIDTLIYYDIPYEHDKNNPDYIIILREMDKYETEVLFEHTKRLRAKKSTLLLEAPKDKPNYAWYRKRDRSTSRVRKVGILEFK